MTDWAGSKVAAGFSVGPRKRLLPLDFEPGSVLRDMQTGENILVRRNDHRGVLVKRAIGSQRARSITAGDEILHVGTVLPWLRDDGQNIPVNNAGLATLVVL